MHVTEHTWTLTNRPRAEISFGAIRLSLEQATRCRYASRACRVLRYRYSYISRLRCYDTVSHIQNIGRCLILRSGRALHYVTTVPSHMPRRDSYVVVAPPLRDANATLRHDRAEPQATSRPFRDRCTAIT